MTIHDWSRVSPGIFHAFHLAWLGRLQDALNESVLPSDFYALAEQQAGDVEPDVLTLQHDLDSDDTSLSRTNGMLLVAEAPPRVWQTATYENASYVTKRRTLSIHAASDDRIVALLEVVSSGNKAGTHAFDQFVDKAISCFDHELHLLIVDLHKPTKRDPQGIHGAIINTFDGSDYEAPVGKNLTLVSYESGIPLKAYIQPISVGDALPDMPLFLERGRYVNVPLEQTYRAAFQGVPRIYKQQLEAA
jgi:hypothetical protein